MSFFQHSQKVFLLMVGLSSILSPSVFASSWPIQNPTTESSGGIAGTYFTNMFGNVETGTGKICANSGVITGFDANGGTKCLENITDGILTQNTTTYTYLGDKTPPSGELLGGSFKQYFTNMFGNVETGTGKICTNSGAVVGFTNNGTPQCAKVIRSTGTNSGVVGIPPLLGISTPSIPMQTNNIPNSNIGQFLQNILNHSCSPNEVLVGFTSTGTLICKAMSDLIPQVQIDTFLVNNVINTSISHGSSVQFTWSTQNAFNCTITDIGPANINSSGFSNAPAITAGSTKTFTLTCYDGASRSASKSVNITSSYPSPGLSFNANATQVLAGANILLSWTANNISSCNATGDWNGNKSHTSGNETLSNLTSNKSYTLNCIGLNGAPISSTVNIEVITPQTPTILFGVANGGGTSMSIGENRTLSWNVANADVCEGGYGYWGNPIENPDRWNGTKNLIDTLSVSPPADTMYVLNCHKTTLGHTITAQAVVIVDVTVPLDGGWTDWSSWSSCSASCGGGTQTRTRSCTQPTPTNGGAQCGGNTTETQSCNVQACYNPPITPIVKISLKTGVWNNIQNVNLGNRRMLLLEASQSDECKLYAGNQLLKTWQGSLESDEWVTPSTDTTYTLRCMKENAGVQTFSEDTLNLIVHTACQLTLTEVQELNNILNVGIDRNAIQWCDTDFVTVQNFNAGYIPNAVGKLKDLYAVNFVNANIQEIPESLFNLEKLEYLNLNNNQITTIPANIKKLAKLEDLWLEKNKITSLPTEFQELPKIRRIYLSNQDPKITTFPSVLINIPTLVSIDLRNNDIAKLPEGLAYQDHLKTLSLYGNNKLGVLANDFSVRTNTCPYIDSNCHDLGQIGVTESGQNMRIKNALQWSEMYNYGNDTLNRKDKGVLIITLY